MHDFKRTFPRQPSLAMFWLMIVIGAILACIQPASAAEDELQGTWIALKAVADGKPAENVVGHRLTFDGNRFQIQSADGKTVFMGSTSIDPTAKPAAIDFVHTQGNIEGKSWKGIYALDGDTLTICDNFSNMDEARPTAFEAKAGSGHGLFTFERAKQ